MTKIMLNKNGQCDEQAIESRLKLKLFACKQRFKRVMKHLLLKKRHLKEIKYNASPSAHIDTFNRDNLPKQSLQPNFLLEQFNYPEYINAAEVDRFHG